MKAVRDRFALQYELKFYLERKMLEDPFQKEEGLIEDFMARYYGAAGGKVLEARKLLDRRRREKKAFIRWFPSMGEFSFFTNDDLAEVRRLFDEAETAVKDDPKRLARVKRAYLSFGRLADFRAKFGGKHPPEKGVSDKPFFDIPTDEQSAENHTKKAIDFVKDIEIGDPLSGGDIVTRIKADVEDREGHYRLPFEIGVYDPIAKKTILKTKWEKPLGKGYNWYSRSGQGFSSSLAWRPPGTDSSQLLRAAEAVGSEAWAVGQEGSGAAVS